MTGAKQNRIGIYLPEGFADWEFGFLAGANGYVDVPCAVSDAHLVTAPGTAPYLLP